MVKEAPEPISNDMTSLRNYRLRRPDPAAKPGAKATITEPMDPRIIRASSGQRRLLLPLLRQKNMKHQR